MCLGGSSNPLIPSVREFGSWAGEDVGTGTYHVASKGKLLAVEFEGVPVFTEAGLAVSALFLQSFDSVSLFIDLVVIIIDAVVVSADVIGIVINIFSVLINVRF